LQAQKLGFCLGLTPSLGPRKATQMSVADSLPLILPRLLAPGRTVVMGILNVTPDSFSDGGRFLAPAQAIAQTKRMIAEGAEIIDVGAESTRPYGGAVPVSAEEERARLKFILPALRDLGAPISIDTMKAEVASWALDAGTAIVNDVWGLQRDPDMADVVSKRAMAVVIMHNREVADPSIDIMADIESFFSRSLNLASNAGIARGRIVLDPGIGFGKTHAQSMTAIAQLPRLKSFGLPLLVGASRKRFIDAVVTSPPDRRIGGSLASHLLAVENGAAIVRTHDVAETVQALRVAEAIRGTR
jgi:dihydropteroate synthase